MVFALRLARVGYGTPEEIMRMPSDIVMKALHYEKFLEDYEQSFVELNAKR